MSKEASDLLRDPSATRLDDDFWVGCRGSAQYLYLGEGENPSPSGEAFRKPGEPEPTQLGAATLRR
jgi:hypothetical protein